MKFLKRNRQKFTAMVLAMAVFVVSMYFSPINVQAARKIYISEVFVSIADTEKEAKNYLTQEKYTILDENLCQGMSWEGFYTAYYAYLGYKTTADPMEAITDMAIMDMWGDYSFARYEEALEQQKTAIAKMVDDLRVVVDEFRSNYAKSLEHTLAAYELLNMYEDPDSSQLIGDFFLNESTTDEQMETLFLQGSSYVLPNIYKCLLAGCGDGQVLVSKLAELDPWQYVDDPQYRDATEELLDSINDLAEEFRAYEQKRDSLKLTDESTTEEIEAAFAEESETDKSEYIITNFKYLLLKNMAYGDDGTTWLEVFLQDSSKMDVALFYPLAAIMSEGQRVMAQYLTVDSILFETTATQEAAKEAEERMDEAVEQYKQDDELLGDLNEEGLDMLERKVISVYVGVDRSLFNSDGVALLNSARTQWGASGDYSWMTAALGNPNAGYNTIYILAMMMSGLSVCGMVYCLARALADKISGTYAVNVAPRVGNAVANANNVADVAEDMGRISQNSEIAQYGMTPLAVAGLCLAAFAICTAIWTGLSIYEYWHPSYKVIPGGMVNTVKDSTGKSVYVRYSAAKQRVFDSEEKEGQVGDEDYCSGDITEEYGNYADLNGWSAKQWNALYTTKDPNAGKPILADILLQYNSASAGRNYDGVHFFNTVNAYDINTHAYNVSEGTEQAYLFFARDMEYDPNGTGSVFAATDVILFIGLSTAAGIVVGAICMWLPGRRKRKKTAQT